jgi:hypothetical protein
MTCAQAHRRALELAAADWSFVHRSMRQWAKAIGCSVGLVAKLPFWRLVQERKRPTGGAPSPPPAIPLTPPVLASVGQDDDPLRRLIEQQQADHEPSPLEDDPPGAPPLRVRCRNRA